MFSYFKVKYFNSIAKTRIEYVMQGMGTQYIYFQGDSGGPLIAERKQDKRYELIGNEY